MDKKLIEKKLIEKKEAYIFDMDGVLIDSEVGNNQPIFDFIKSTPIVKSTWTSE